MRPLQHETRAEVWPGESELAAGARHPQRWRDRLSEGWDQSALLHIGADHAGSDIRLADRASQGVSRSARRSDVAADENLAAWPDGHRIHALVRTCAGVKAFVQVSARMEVRDSTPDPGADAGKKTRRPTPARRRA